MLESYRPLIWLWAAILSFSAMGMATLQILGPPVARGLLQDRPQAVAPPSPPRADQPVAAASLPSAAVSTASRPAPAPISLPPAAAEQPALASSAPAVPAQPSRRRAHSWVRKGASPMRAPDGQSAGDDNFLVERGQSASRFGPMPQDRDPLPPAAAPNSRAQASAYQHVAGYIGIFTTGADGTRVFRATP